MTCCTGSVYGPSRWPPSWATCGPPVAPWGSTPLLTTGGSGNSPPWSGNPAARERRVPRMANATSPLVEQRVVAFALGHPGFGPARIAAELARAQVGRDCPVDQWGVAGPAPPRPRQPRQRDG